MAKKPDIPLQSSGFVASLPIPPPLKTKDYLKAYTDWVFACVTTISTEVSDIHLKLFERKARKGEDEIEPVLEHEALALLRYVNDFMTFHQLVEITETYLQLTGEAYWAKLRFNDGKIAELWPLRPDWVKVIPSEDNFIKGYAYLPDNNPKDAVVFDKDDMVIFKDLDPTNAYRGMGVVRAAAQSIDIDEFSNDYIRAFFFNSAMPGLVFTSDKKLKEAEVKRFLKQWESKFKGRKQAHKVAFVGGGMKPTIVTSSASDMQFLDMKKYVRDEIMALFKVPKSVLGITEDVNRANAEQTVRQFKSGIISPRMAKLTTYLNEFYLTEWPDEDLFFDFEDPTPEDRELDLKIYQNGLQNGWLTPNEVRELENREPLEGGDDLPKPSRTTEPTVVDKVKGVFSKRQVKEYVKAKKIRKFNLPPPHKKLHVMRKEKFKKELKHDLKKLITTMQVSEQKKDMAKDRRDNFWKEMIVQTDVLEDVMRDLLVKNFEEQRSDVLNNLTLVKYHRKDYRKGKETTIIFNIGNEGKKWLSIYTPFVKQVLREKGAEILSFLGIRADLDLNTDTAAEWLRVSGLEFITQVNETTVESLKISLAEGLSAGESVDELAIRVNDIYDMATTSRSEMIARTEVLRATNFATLEAYDQSGVVEAKEWLTALDERVHDGCAAIDGQIVKLGESFSTEEGPLESPPMHPNCRCTTIPLLIDKKSKEPATKNKFVHDVDKIYAKIQKKEAEKEKVKVKKRTQEMELEAKVKASEIKAKAISEAKEIEAETVSLLERVKNKLKGLVK